MRRDRERARPSILPGALATIRVEARFNLRAGINITPDWTFDDKGWVEPIPSGPLLTIATDDHPLPMILILDAQRLLWYHVPRHIIDEIVDEPEIRT